METSGLDPGRDHLSITSIVGEDIEHPATRAKIFEIRMYGRMLDGRTACVHIRNYRPCVHIGVRVAGGTKQMELLRTIIIRMILPCVRGSTWSRQERGFVRGEPALRCLNERSAFGGRQLKLGFDPQPESSRFWKAEFPSKRALQDFRTAWATSFQSSPGFSINIRAALEELLLALRAGAGGGGITVPCGVTELMLQYYLGQLAALDVHESTCVSLFHSELPPDVYFVHERDIQSAGWVSLPVLPPSESAAVADYSTQDVDLLVSADDVRAVNDNRYLNEEFRVPTVIASSDIETTGLYPFRTTMSMLPFAQSFLTYWASTLYSADRAALLADSLLHLFGVRVCADRFHLRSDLVMTHGAVTAESVAALLAAPVPTDWYAQLLDLCAEENDLSDKQQAMRDARKEAVRAWSRDGDKDGEKEEEDGDDASASASSDSDSDSEDEDGGDDGARPEVQENLEDERRAQQDEARAAEALQAERQTHTLALLRQARADQFDLPFTVSGQASLAEVLLQAPLFRDEEMAARMLVFQWSRAFGAPRADHVFDITTSLAHPWEDEPHETRAFLWVPHLLPHLAVLPTRFRGATLVWCSSEAELITRWVRWLTLEANPDMHIGYNWAGFDCPFLYTRARLLGVVREFMQQSRVRGHVCTGQQPRPPQHLSGSERWRWIESQLPVLASRQTKLPNNQFMTEQFVPTEGCMQLDVLVLLKKTRNYPCFKLDYVAALNISSKIQDFMLDEARGLLLVCVESLQGLAAGDYVSLYVNSDLMAETNKLPKLKVMAVGRGGTPSLKPQQSWFLARPPQDSARFRDLIPFTEDSEVAGFRRLLTHDSLRLVAAPGCAELEDVVDDTLDGDAMAREDAEATAILREVVAFLREARDVRKMKLAWGFAKDDMGHEEMRQSAESGSLDEVLLVAKYCFRDCALPLLLMKLMNVYMAAQSMSRLSKVSMDLILARGQSIRLLSFLSNLCMQRRILLAGEYRPFVRETEQQQRNKVKRKNYDGAIVLTPRTGIYLAPTLARVSGMAPRAVAGLLAAVTSSSKQPLQITNGGGEASVAELVQALTDCALDDPQLARELVRARAPNLTVRELVRALAPMPPQQVMDTLTRTHLLPAGWARALEAFADSLVAVMDFSSLYPSLIIAYMLSLATKAAVLTIDEATGRVLERWVSPGLRDVMTRMTSAVVAAAAADPSSPSPPTFLRVLDGGTETVNYPEDFQCAERFTDPATGRRFVLTNVDFDRKEYLKETYGKVKLRTKDVLRKTGRTIVFQAYEAHIMRRTLSPAVVAAFGFRAPGGEASSPPTEDIPALFPLAIIPSMCRQFIDGRDVAKRKQAQATTEHTRAIFEIEQKTVKEMNNSVYGQLGFESGQFRDFHIANCVTAAGRRSLLFTKSLLEAGGPVHARTFLVDHSRRAPRQLHRVPIPETVGDLLASEEANDELLAWYEHLLETDPLLEVERQALHMARARLAGLFLLENTTGFLQFRDRVLEAQLNRKRKRKEETQDGPLTIEWPQAVDALTGLPVISLSKEACSNGSEKLLRRLHSVAVFDGEYVYGDTDSVFYRNKTRFRLYFGEGADDIREAPGRCADEPEPELAPGEEPAGFGHMGQDAVDRRFVAQAVGTYISRLVSLFQPPPMKLAFEKIMLALTLYTCKRYVGLKFEDSMVSGKMHISGLNMKRKDACNWVKGVSMFYTMAVGMGMGMGEILSSLRADFENLFAGRVPLEMLTLTCGIRHKYKKPETIKQLQLAARIAVREPANAPRAGDRVTFLFVVPQGMDMLRERYRIKALKAGERIETPEYVRAAGLQPDYYYYVKSQLYKPLMQFFALSIREVYAHLGLNEVFEREVLPVLAEREARSMGRDGILEAEYTKWKEAYCVNKVSALLHDVLFAPIRGALTTATAAKRAALPDGGASSSKRPRLSSSRMPGAEHVRNCASAATRRPGSRRALTAASQQQKQKTLLQFFQSAGDAGRVSSSSSSSSSPTARSLLPPI